ncbi:M20/M25/M40 family metallo-hydrolase (plasmid) [Thermoanaerobacterium thermosaccharolyticum]|uniref:M20/M25/M40 family metallo-hydrolase n=1 Tax=Thermoanaerobacterium thermosaccharolyticum TaxID=1517 RepID=UPI003DA7E950
MEFKDQLMKTMLDIVAVPGISGTESENLAADKVYEILESIPYFKNNPNNLKKISIKDDPLGRTFVSALFCSKTKTDKTLIFMGHHDVVGVESYGHLKDIAFNPIELNKRIKELDLPNDAIDDLESGEWLFGRGVSDMKFGLALAIELIREISEKDDFVGNILFISVPGEETNSEGMLGAIEHLVELQNSGYKYISLMLLEPSSLGGTEEDKNIYLGAGGKVNVLLLFAGMPSHVAEPFNGLNANLLASEFNRLFELNLDMCEEYGGEFTYPPTCLTQVDLRKLYDVTTSLYTAAYYNIQTLNIKVEDLIGKIKKIALQAFENTLKVYHEKCDAFSKKHRMKIRPINVKPLVLTYNEVYNVVKERFGDEFDRHLNQKIKEWKAVGCDKQTIAIYIAKETFDWYPNKVPAIVIGFAPPFYPCRYPELEREDYKILLSATDEMIDYAKKKFNVNISKENFFAVSDFSYIELGDKNGLDEISTNLVGFDKTYIFPAEELKKLSIPGIVFGAWGKDIHKNTERINVPYSFEIVPELCRHFIYNQFEKAK